MTVESDNGALFRKKPSGKNYLFMQKGKPKAVHYHIKFYGGKNDS